MSRKRRIPPLPPIPAPPRPKPKTVAPVVKAKIEPPTLADHFRGDDRYLAHFKTLPPDQREVAIKTAKTDIVERGELSGHGYNARCDDDSGPSRGAYGFSDAIALTALRGAVIPLICRGQLDESD